MHETDDASGRVYAANHRTNNLFARSDVDADQAVIDQANQFRSEIEANAVFPRYPSGHMVPRKDSDRILPRWREVKRALRSLLPLAWAVAIAAVCIVIGAGNAGLLS